MITGAAFAINLFLGLLYAWSVIKKSLVDDWGWNDVTASLPFTFSAATFAFMMIFAGRAQDKFGPRIVVMLGGLMFSAGVIASGFSTNPVVMIITFGIMGGIGIALGYSATTPCAIKWFDPSRKGVVSGIVVSGVGIAPVLFAPLANFLINRHGLQQTFIILGVLAFVAIVLFGLILRNPAKGYVPGTQDATRTASGIRQVNMEWRAMLRTPQFYLLWFIYLLTATAGLMLIAHIASIAGTQAAWQAGFVLVVVLSAFNALGRVLIGYLSDVIGRKTTMVTVFLLQALNMFLFACYTSIPLLMMGAVFAGLLYGSLFSLMPSVTADFFGIKNLGVNYGLVFSGWGVGAVIGPLLGGIAVVTAGTYQLSYWVSGILLIAGAVLAKLIRPVRRTD